MHSKRPSKFQSPRASGRLLNAYLGISVSFVPHTQRPSSYFHSILLEPVVVRLPRPMEGNGVTPIFRSLQNCQFHHRRLESLEHFNVLYIYIFPLEPLTGRQPPLTIYLLFSLIYAETIPPLSPAILLDHHHHSLLHTFLSYFIPSIASPSLLIFLSRFTSPYRPNLSQT